MNANKAAKKRTIRTYLAIFPALVLINTLLAWFGGWGVLAAYLGCIVGAGWLGGIPFGINLYWSLADVWQVLVPLAAFKAFNADFGMRTKRDFAVFLCFGWLLNNAIGAAWGAATLAVSGLALWSEVTGIFTGWLIGNLIVTGAISPLLLRYGTPWLEEHELLVAGYWA